MKLFTTLILSLLFASQALASNVSSLSYSGTNVTTGAYVTLVASTPIPVSHLIVCDNSGHILKIASGAAASEIDLFTVSINACLLVPIAPTLPAGTRLSIRAIDATANSGYNTVSFLP